MGTTSSIIGIAAFKIVGNKFVIPGFRFSVDFYNGVFYANITEGCIFFQEKPISNSNFTKVCK